MPSACVVLSCATLPTRCSTTAKHQEPNGGARCTPSMASSRHSCQSHDGVVSWMDRASQRSDSIGGRFYAYLIDGFISRRARRLPLAAVHRVASRRGTWLWGWIWTRSASAAAARRTVPVLRARQRSRASPRTSIKVTRTWLYTARARPTCGDGRPQRARFLSVFLPWCQKNYVPDSRTQNSYWDLLICRAYVLLPCIRMHTPWAPWMPDYPTMARLKRKKKFWSGAGGDRLQKTFSRLQDCNPAPTYLTRAQVHDPMVRYPRLSTPCAICGGPSSALGSRAFVSSTQPCFGGYRSYGSKRFCIITSSLQCRNVLGSTYQFTRQHQIDA